MKKVLLGSLAALFAVAMLVTSCDEDITEKCTTCYDGDQEYKVCWEKGRALDMTSELLEWSLDHPNGYCDDVDTP